MTSLTAGGALLDLLVMWATSSGRPRRHRRTGRWRAQARRCGRAPSTSCRRRRPTGSPIASAAAATGEGSRSSPVTTKCVGRGRSRSGARGCVTGGRVVCGDGSALAQRRDDAAKMMVRACADVDDTGLAQDRQQLGAALDESVGRRPARARARRRASRSGSRRRRASGRGSAMWAIARGAGGHLATTVEDGALGGCRGTNPYARSAARAVAAATRTGSTARPDGRWSPPRHRGPAAQDDAAVPRAPATPRGRRSAIWSRPFRRSAPWVERVSARSGTARKGQRHVAPPPSSNQEDVHLVRPPWRRDFDCAKEQPAL